MSFDTNSTSSQLVNYYYYRNVKSERRLRFPSHFFTPLVSRIDKTGRSLKLG